MSEPAVAGQARPVTRWAGAVVGARRTGCRGPRGQHVAPRPRVGGLVRAGQVFSVGAQVDRDDVGMRVLVVEDDVRMAGAIRRGLRAEGFIADVALRGTDALGMVLATDYDAVVLDVMLPDQDGVA